MAVLLLEALILMRKFADKVSDLIGFILRSYRCNRCIGIILKTCSKNVTRENLTKIVNARYAGWNSELGQHILCKVKLHLKHLRNLSNKKI